MEHIIVKATRNPGFFRLKAEPGFLLYSRRLERYVSEAVVKEDQFSEFEAHQVLD